MPPSKRAFTLVELLVVVSIIAMLIALLLPSLGRARGQAKLTMCGTNLHQLGLAKDMYADNNRDSYPAWSQWHVWGYYGTDQDGEDGDDEGPAWTELLRDDRSLSSINIYRCPGFPAQIVVAYFHAAYAAWERHDQEQATRRSWVRYPSEFVLAGDCTNPMFYSPPFGTNLPLDINDADMDNASQRSLDWDNPIHMRDKNNILFADGHAAPFSEFRPSQMTHDTRQRHIDWGELDLEDQEGQSSVVSRHGPNLRSIGR